MPVAHWTDRDAAEARRIWKAYQQIHDLTDQIGKTAGIDPATGRVWIGESITDIVTQRQSEGLTSPVRFERIGSPAYWRKGGRR